MKIKRFLKKILNGEHPIKIKYSKENWDVQYKKGNWDFLLKKHENVIHVVQTLKDIASQRGKIEILDVGCGNGALARELSQDSFSYTGLDISAEALTQAKIVAPHGKYLQASMDDKPPLVGKFDVIVFCEVLLYGDYEKILKTYQPYLKPDGFLIISLYDVWRTKVIWVSIKKQINILNLVFVKNLTRNVGWTICLGKYREDTINN